MKLIIMKILNFSTITSSKICRPRATKIVQNMFSGCFSAKNVQRLSFELLVALKLKYQGGGHNSPPLDNKVYVELNNVYTILMILHKRVRVSELESLL